MKKNFLNVKNGILILMLLTLGSSCKKGVNTNYEKAAEVANAITSKPKKHPKEKALPIPENERRSAAMKISAIYGCNTMMTGEYWDVGYYNYPEYEMEFANNVGGTATLTLYSYMVPNRFTLLSPNRTIISQTGWIGTADYGGPWGSELNTEDGVQLTFNVTMSGNYILQVETQTDQTSDYWEAQINCVEADLATRIANHQSFINLNDLFDQALNMPTPDTFTQNFDTAQLSSQGNTYLSGITGLSLSAATTINNGIQTNGQSLVNAFPELANKTQAQLDSIFLEATDKFLAKQRTLRIETTCAECKRVGRRNMLVGIFMGATSGSTWGFFGAWAGATLGFWVAADDALTCLKTCTK